MIRFLIPWLVGIVAALTVVAGDVVPNSASVEPALGPVLKTPPKPSGLVEGGAHKLDETPALNVNTESREETRQFYNAVYTASDGIPMNSSAVVASCDAGTNSTAFQDAELLRINWFRAMSGILSSVTFSASESADDQIAALLISVNNQLQDVNIPSSWKCFNTVGTNAAFNSDLALGLDGPAAITGYIQDTGAGNEPVGHRRWILYPQTQVMACGDVPAQGSNFAANATWITDANLGGPRPMTKSSFIAWPPPGYAPYPVVFPRWSFALSHTDLANATVTMLSNGVPLSVVIEPYEINLGENTMAWHPANLDPNIYNTVFPFNGTDTVYDISITTAGTNIGSQSYNYSVTVFDPTLPGADYSPTLISGTNQPSVSENNSYVASPSANPNITGFQWAISQATNGNLLDTATNGLKNFTISPPPIYSVITNPPVGTSKCFHLTHTNAVPELLQFTEILFPATNSALSFAGLLGYATTNETARVQISTNAGVAWMDIFTQKGTGTSGQAAFVAHTLSLSNFAGKITLMRFNYDYAGGNYYSQTKNNVGWCLEHIVITNSSKLVNFTTNVTASTNLNFVPTLAGDWVLETRGLIFNQFGLDWSPAVEVLAVTNSLPTQIFLSPPAVVAGQLQIPFTVTHGASSSFSLLEASQLNGPWTTNSAAVLSNPGSGASFQFTTPIDGVAGFYRVAVR